MALDQAENFVRGATAASVDSTQTSVSVQDASLFPDPSGDEYNAVLWDADQYPRPDQDPNVEIVRVTARDTGANTLTVARGQESTAGASHPSGSALQMSPTAKMFNDIEARYVADGEDFDGQGASAFSGLASVNGADLANATARKVPTAQGDGTLAMEQTVPEGVITMWSGTTSDVPNGWTLCDGTDGTPDLRDRFVVGAGGSYSADDTGGADSVTLTESEMPSHSHTGSTTTDGEHTHSFDAGNDLSDPSTLPGTAGDQNDSRNTDSAGDHSHTLNIDDTGGDAAHENRPPYYALAFIMKT